MMKTLVILISTLLIHIGVLAQDATKVKAKSLVLLDAEKMASAFLRGDYKTYVGYIYPSLLQKAGGKEIFMAKMEQSINELRSQGTMYDTIIISEPSPTVRCSGELQCLVKQVSVLRTAGQQTHNDVTYLVAISANKGRSWKFLNGARRPIAVLRNDFPNVCETLPLEPKYLGE
jgi:hypothetical protein